MPSWLVDTHCHLDLMPGILERYQHEDQLPIKTISVTNAPSFFQYSQTLFKDAKNVRIAIGMHPELVSQFHSELATFKSLLAQSRYVGEIGLDGSERFKSTLRLQGEIFNGIVKSCAQADRKVLTVHTRNAEKEAIQILKNSLAKSECRVILHWFSGNLDTLKEAISAGFYLSINHKMVSTKKGQDLIKHIPSKLLLTETDAPFTTDSKMTRFDSLNKCINGLAAISGRDEEELKADVFDNFRQLLL
jgi:TatD DNase family protein